MNFFGNFHICNNGGKPTVRIPTMLSLNRFPPTQLQQREWNNFSEYLLLESEKLCTIVAKIAPRMHHFYFCLRVDYKTI